MVPVRAACVLGLVLSGSAAAEPVPARTAVPLPVPAATMAQALSLPSADRGPLLLNAVRVLFDPPDSPAALGDAARARLAALFAAASRGPHETVPLPLTPKIWRETIFDVPIQERDVVAGICAHRSAALMYVGLSALDDETLEWLARHRDVLVHLKRHAGAFAAFGRSIRIARGRVAVPGGAAAEPLWRALTGSDPSQPAPFIRAVFRGDKGRLAFFYDVVAHLDAGKQRLVLGAPDDAGGRTRALLDVFQSFARDWDVELRPFTRPQLDPMLFLEAASLADDGTLAGPGDEGIWSRVFQDDAHFDVQFREVPPWKGEAGSPRVDAAWLASRIHLQAYPTGRRRLETFLFGQRMFADASAEPHAIATLLRAFGAMPALMLTLERIGVRDARVLLLTARHAHALNAIGNSGARSGAVAVFQSALGFVERGRFARALSDSVAGSLVSSLASIPVDGGSRYEERVAQWLRSALFKAAPQPPLEATDPVEMAVLALLSGMRADRPVPIVEWEGERYRADPAGAELKRMLRVREQQDTLTIDGAITQLQGAAQTGDARARAAREFAATLASMLYAAHLGDPEGPALAAGNVALRHEMGGAGMRPGLPPISAWKLPYEVFARPAGWHVQGSLLGLDVALRRLALRRLDLARLPSGPKLPLIERQSAMLTVVLASPHALTEDGRDRIASAMARGRARLEALVADPSSAARIAEDAGLSEWRRESLRWALTHAPAEALADLNPLEMLWLGANGEAAGLDEWGAAVLPLNGCVCLKMPRRAPWENLTGRPASGLLATRGVDATLRVAEVLAGLKLPASLAPGVLAYAMQDVLDETQPAYFEEWQAFGRAAKGLSTERVVDYIAALTAGGPLIPVAEAATGRH